ncbi:isoliquiritigenin 2'-O-methyltransferase-like [Vigna radiata var. radiata]|uniref:Isoliquiritigenin 2'-O-methyltransferase-like n=1 Tax=Vigna radiata var. radiata TaxID=3916 RepID=A0A1S3U0C1_VIGRR|nr:isoliquiritigenin 2'-O-methyltransferase-like [Vigna radiata var. radiata]
MGSNCEEIDGEENDPCLSALLLSFSPMVYTAVLNASIELNLFEIIAKATKTTTPLGVSASEIASQLPIQHKKLPQRLDRMLSVLASHSLLTCSTLTNQDGKVQRLFQLSPSGKYFTNAEATASLALFTTFMNHPKLVQAFLNFKEIVLDCDKGLYMKVHGMPIFEGIQSDPTWNHIFNEAMANICRIEMTKILEIYSGFEGISLLIDVGGGVGQSLNIIISKYPSIKGVNFDLPQVIKQAPPYPGIEHVEGDMFESVPKGDAILLKGILHNWSDENCLKVLNNCYKALPENGKVVVVDFIMPEAIGSSEADKMVASFDNLMFLDGGSERTEKEFMNLCQISAFSSFRVVSRAFTALGVMEFYKN